MGPRWITQDDIKARSRDAWQVDSSKLPGPTSASTLTVRSPGEYPSGGANQPGWRRRLGAVPNRVARFATAHRKASNVHSDGSFDTAGGGEQLRMACDPRSHTREPSASEVTDAVRERPEALGRALRMPISPTPACTRRTSKVRRSRTRGSTTPTSPVISKASA